VVAGGDISREAYLSIDDGVLVNSGFISGLSVTEGIEQIKNWLTEHNLGSPKTNYKLRDWVFSRQRYWGEPIPMVHCEQCGWQPLPESELPLLLRKFALMNCPKQVNHRCLCSPGCIGILQYVEKEGVTKDVIVAEAQTFIFASRMSNPGVTRIFRIKNAVPVSALPASRNPELAKYCYEVMPEFDVVKNILYTSFNNIGVVLHPATLILNAARVETTAGKFRILFRSVSSPSVAKVLEKIDEERCRVSGAFQCSTDDCKRMVELRLRCQRSKFISSYSQ